MPSHAIPPLRLVKHQILDEFKSLNLPRTEWQPWFEAQAERHAIKVIEVKHIVTEYMDQMDFMVQEALASRSQKIAQSLGATLLAAVQVYVDGLKATKTQFITREDEDGNRTSEPYEMVDYEARHKSATKIIEIHGGFAPVETKQIVQHELDKLTEGELARLITQGLLESRATTPNATSASISEQPAIPGVVEVSVQSEVELPGSPTPSQTNTGTNGKVVHRRPLLLDDERDSNKGRAARPRSGPVPPVPQKKVYSRMPPSRPRS